jgi:ABC-type Fe3+/spermidine/putrescine transport system ATPase subunit
MKSPNDIYVRPANLFVAQFVGEMNFVKGKVTGAGQVESTLGLISAPVPNGVNAGAPVTLAIRPEHVNLTQPNGQSETTAVGKIVAKNYLGDSALLEVDVNGVTLLAKLAGDCDLSVGGQAAVELPTHRWRVFP